MSGLGELVLGFCGLGEIESDGVRVGMSVFDAGVSGEGEIMSGGVVLGIGVPVLGAGVTFMQREFMGNLSQKLSSSSGESSRSGDVLLDCAKATPLVSESERIIPTKVRCLIFMKLRRFVELLRRFNRAL